ncbi:MAG: flagellar motor switch protein FliG [Deltaproteobacteria bacterium]|nr:MAG: flagellar motor switch protein FliG [Deltaproteobacteria bacterium]
MQRLTGPQKASIFLLTLDPETATQVMRHLNEDEIRLITKTIANLDMVSQETVENVLKEVKEKAENIALIHQAREFLQNVVAKVLGEKKSAELGQVIDAFNPDAIEAAFDTKMLATFIQDEHPQIIALIISSLAPSSAKEILAELPDHIRAEVIYRISRMESIPPEVVEEVQKTLKEKITSSASSQSRHRGGINKVVELAKSLDFKTLESILNELQAIDPDLASIIEQQLFTFEDLGNLDDRSIQILLREIDTKDLALALKTASEELKGKFLRNLSERAREMLMEDMEVMGPVKIKDVENAQQKIVDIAKKLESEGKIILQQGGSEGDVFV